MFHNQRPYSGKLVAYINARRYMLANTESGASLFAGPRGILPWDIMKAFFYRSISQALQFLIGGKCQRNSQNPILSSYRVKPGQLLREFHAFRNLGVFQGYRVARESIGFKPFIGPSGFLPWTSGFADYIWQSQKKGKSGSFSFILGGHGVFNHGDFHFQKCGSNQDKFYPHALP